MAKLLLIFQRLSLIIFNFRGLFLSSMFLMLRDQWSDPQIPQITRIRRKEEGRRTEDRGQKRKQRKGISRTPEEYAPVRFAEPTPVKCAMLSFGIELGRRGKQNTQRLEINKLAADKRR